MTDKSFGDHMNRNTVKNPLLSTAVTGLSLEDVTHNAVLLPVSQSQEVITRQDQHYGSQTRPLAHTDHALPNYPSSDVNSNLFTAIPPSDIHFTLCNTNQAIKTEKIYENPSSTQSEAHAKSDDDFDVNEYFARLQGTIYVSAPLNTNLKDDSLEAKEDNLEEINLNDPERPVADIQQSITADIAQNFSQLPTVLPQVASAVFSSFSSMLSMKSREHTPYEPRPSGYEEVQCQQPETVPLISVPDVKDVAPPLKEPPPVGTGNYRLTTRKKYAQIPGLTSGDTSQITISQNDEYNPSKSIPPYFVPTSASVTVEGAQEIPKAVKTVTDAFHQTGDGVHQTVKENQTSHSYTFLNPNNYNVPSIPVEQAKTSESQPNLVAATDKSASIFVSTQTSDVTKQPSLQFYGESAQASPDNMPTSQPNTGIIPPPPMFSNIPRKDSQTGVGKTILPPSIARRISAINPVIKAQAPPAALIAGNYFVPASIPDQADVSFFTPDIAASSIPLHSSELPASSEAALFSPTQDSVIFTPASSNTIPHEIHIMRTSANGVSTSVASAASSASLLEQPSSVKPPMQIPPPNLPPPPLFPPGLPPLSFAQNIPSPPKHSSGILSMSSTPSKPFQTPPAMFTPANVSQSGSETILTPPMLFNPATLTQGESPVDQIGIQPSKPHNLPIEEPAKAIEPPKVTGNLSYRMTKKRPQYYAGPIVGVGAISNNYKPVLQPVETSSFQGALFAPAQQITEIVDAAVPNIDLATVPFDIGQPAQAAYIPFESSKPQQNTYAQPEFNTAFDFSRPSETYEPPKQETKGFGIIGSLKSKLSSIDINKLQNTVTTFFDPSYNDTKKADDANPQENVPYGYQPQSYGQSLGQYSQNRSNFEIYVPNAELTQQYKQGYGCTAFQSKNPLYNRADDAQYLQTQDSQSYYQNQGQNVHPSSYSYNTLQHYPTSAPELCSSTSNVQGNAHMTEEHINSQRDRNVHESTPADASYVHEHDNKTVKEAMFTPVAPESDTAAIGFFNNPHSIVYAANDEKIEPQKSNFVITGDIANKKVMKSEIDPNTGFFDKSQPKSEEMDINLAHNVSDQNVFKPEFDSSALSFFNNPQPIAELFNERGIEFKKADPHSVVSISDKIENLPISIDVKHDRLEYEPLERVSNFFTILPFPNESVTRVNAFSNLLFEENQTLDILKQDKKFADDDFKKATAPTCGTSTALLGLSAMLADKSKELTDLENDVKNMALTEPKNIDTIFNRGANTNFFEDVHLRSQPLLVEDQTGVDKVCEVEVDDLTAYLIDNITSPIQLLNPVEVPLTESNTPVDERADFDSNQCAEISYITEETIETIQVQSATELLDDDKLTTNARSYGWYTEESSFAPKELKETDYGLQMKLQPTNRDFSVNHPQKSIMDHDYSQINPISGHEYGVLNRNSIGFVGSKSLFTENVSVCASNEITADFMFPHDHSPIVLPRQMSIPSAPLAEDDKLDESRIDVHSIELDAKKDFPYMDELVVESDETKATEIEPPVTDPPVTDPPETEPSEIDQPEIHPPKIDSPEIDPPKIELTEIDQPRLRRNDTFTDRVERFKKMEGESSSDTIEIPKLSFDVITSISPPMPMASYFDTGNYAAETYYRNCIISNKMRIPPGFEEEYARRLSIQGIIVNRKNDIPYGIIPYIPDCSTQTRPTFSPTFSTAQTNATITGFVYDKKPNFEAVPPSDNILNVKKEINLPCIPIDIPPLFSTKEEDINKLHALGRANVSGLEDLSYSLENSQLPVLSNIFGAKREMKTEPHTTEWPSTFSELKTAIKDNSEKSQGDIVATTPILSNILDIDKIISDDDPQLPDLGTTGMAIEAAVEKHDTMPAYNIFGAEVVSVQECDIATPTFFNPVAPIAKPIVRDSSKLFSNDILPPSAHANFGSKTNESAEKGAAVAKPVAPIGKPIPDPLKYISRDRLFIQRTNAVGIPKADAPHQNTEISTIFVNPVAPVAKTNLQDHVNFFSTIDQSTSTHNSTTVDNSFSRLASYFASTKSDNSKSFFELSQGQDHYRHDSKTTDVGSGDTASNVKSFFELSQSQNHYIDNIHNIPHDKYVANLNLMKDLTSIENITNDADQIVRSVNYFTVEYDNEHLDFEQNIGEPETKNKPDLKNDGNKETIPDDETAKRLITNCKYCCNNKINGKFYDNLDHENVFTKQFQVKKGMDNTSEAKKESDNNMQQNKDNPNAYSVTVNFGKESIQEDYNDGVTALGENRSIGEYTPVKHHWFYRVDVEGKSIWRGFSTLDSRALEEAHHSVDLDENTLVATDGGRFDVNVQGRLRTAVYWTEDPTSVRRCSWFYKGTTDARYVPYTEDVADKLEEEYRHGVTTGEWHRRLALPNNEAVVMHGPAVMVHLPPAAASDAFSGPPLILFSFAKRVYRSPPKINVLKDQCGRIDHLLLIVHGAGEYRRQKEKLQFQATSRPRVVRRGREESEIEDVEPSSIDHLLLLCHGVGSACDMRFRSVVEVVNEFRATSLQLLQSHYRHAYDGGHVGRVEVLPISWHATLHQGSAGVDRRLAQITLSSIPRLRSFTNDTVLDVLFYTSPVFCQTIIDTVCAELNRVHALFRARNPRFAGTVSVGGHSLGSVILYDLLCHQAAAAPGGADGKPVPGAAGTGQASVMYPVLQFAPVALYALGSPIAIFECIRGVDCLGGEFSLPTCPNFFNIFHPYDPIAYRIEPLINPELKNVKPFLIPHHKGRKRMHLELKETMARVGADIKQKLVESIKSTWSSMWKSQPPPCDRQLEKVVEEEMEKEHLAGQTKEEHDDVVATVEMLGQLNGGRRVDYVLQEAPFELINEYLFAMSSHVCYWESEDTMLMILREIYDALGVRPDCSVPQHSLTVQRTRVTVNEDTVVLNAADHPSTSRDSA